MDFKLDAHDREVFQPDEVIHRPNEHAYTRITELRCLTGQRHPKTSVVYEFPISEGDPCSPVPRPESAEIYRK
ncbi:UDP-galactopyranose mutase [Sorangium sp. So ce513]|uniref:UDP-galactopyranose mutase n=1 Tax=Sorangium sp. So ce513 TaxID=3133315 RepID=UPI003F5EB437